MLQPLKYVGLILVFAALAVLGAVRPAAAQWNPPDSGDSYANIYNQQLSESGRPLRPQTYLWDRYYYNNPNVSPYLNLARIQPYGSNDYLTYVQPQLQARDATAARSSIGGPQMSGNRPSTAPRSTGSISLHPFGASSGQIEPYSSSAPSRNSSFYYNHWYGGWEGRH